jgi:hypothetical protein
MPTLSGGCACGAIHYTSEGDTLFALNCHCRDCQRERAALRCDGSGPAESRSGAGEAVQLELSSSTDRAWDSGISPGQTRIGLGNALSISSR